MIIQKYGLSLSSLKKEDLELVRNWRNSDFIRSQMLYKKQINSEMQKEWFSSLDSNSVYLVIELHSKKIGLINVKNIDWNERSGEAGIFIGIEKYRNTIDPVLAIFALMDVFFENFSFKKLTAKVIKKNQSALKMNLELGYQIKTEKEEYNELEISANSYQNRTRELKSKIEKLSPQDFFLDLNAEEEQLFLNSDSK